MKIEYERLIGRSVVNLLTRELQLAGIKMDINRFLRILIIGGLALFIIIPFALFLGLGLNPALAAVAGIILAVIFEVAIYGILEFKIEQRRTFMETLLPDYLQLAAANVRSGIALDKSMVLAARPEFGYFSDDVKEMNRELYGGETLQQAMFNLGKKYRSLQLQHTIRMMVEGIQYGGGMTDLLNQIAKDIRNQHMVQREISGQLFMYTIFIAFAALIGAPVLYALTSQMIGVTDTVWAGILKQNPGGLPTAGVSFLRPSPPKITIDAYHNFALASVILICGFGAFIVSAISTGSVLKGLRFLPIFLIVGLAVFFIVSSLIGGIFTSISGV
ncbi:MAG: type II secretion system F family protein [Candidatus Micrarchaeota archaeon]|nr:type II secretion system F family protein [Candidatus Micrarchaeota archaeon]